MAQPNQVHLTDDEDDAQEMLRSCVRALLGLAYRTPGFDVQVAAPDRDWSVRLQHVEGGLAAQLIRTGDRRAGRTIDLTPSSASIDSELAELLSS